MMLGAKPPAFSSKALAKKAKPAKAKKIPMHAGVSADTAPGSRGKPFRTPNTLPSFTLR